MREYIFNKPLKHKTPFVENKIYTPQDGVITLKVDEYYIDEDYNTYFTFDGIGEFELDRTKNLDFSKVLSLKTTKSHFVLDRLDKDLAKLDKALLFILDNKKSIHKKYYEMLERMLERKINAK